MGCVAPGGGGSTMIISFALVSVASYVTQFRNAGLQCLEFYVLIFLLLFQTNELLGILHKLFQALVR
jgi:hypothetical protein